MMFRELWHVLLIGGSLQRVLSIPSRYVVKSKITVPTGWTRVAVPSPGQILTVRIGIKHDGNELERHITEVSDPSHRRYGQYLSQAEVNALAQPLHAPLQTTQMWLREEGLGDRNWTFSKAKDWLSLEVSIRELERLLRTDYAVFQHTDGTTAMRCVSWFLPGAVADSIDVIEPTNAFHRATQQSRYGGIAPPDWEVEHRTPTHSELVEEDRVDRGHLHIPLRDELSSSPTVDEACNRLAISPICLSALYGIWGYKQMASERNSIALVNFLGEVNNRSDIDLYLQRYHPVAAQAKAADKFITELVAGGEDSQSRLPDEQLDAHRGFEGALDAQTIIGMSWPVPLKAYNVGSKPPFDRMKNHTENTNEPYLTWLEHLLAQDLLPHVISISYADDEKTVPPEYARRVCYEFAKLAARGVTVLVASGDWGVGQDSQCFSRSEPQTARFAPAFPASCPFVTSVGGTRLLPGQKEIVGFDGRGSFVSGGGFSDIFERPSYQHQAVQEYLDALGDTYSGLFNADGRAYPDIAAQSYHFSVLYNGNAQLQDGTSAAAPTVASIVALVNDALLASGRPQLGFLNPWLYYRGYRGFKDVTDGSNSGCNMSGFPAAVGWDPATGFGTPWFPALKELAMKRQFRYSKPWYAE